MTNLKIDKLQNITKKPFHLCTKSLQLANHFILTISSPHTTHFPHYPFPCSRRIKHSTKFCFANQLSRFSISRKKAQKSIDKSERTVGIYWHKNLDWKEQPNGNFLRLHIPEFNSLLFCPFKYTWRNLHGKL